MINISTLQYVRIGDQNSDIQCWRYNMRPTDMITNSISVDAAFEIIDTFYESCVSSFLSELIAFYVHLWSVGRSSSCINHKNLIVRMFCSVLPKGLSRWLYDRVLLIDANWAWKTKSCSQVPIARLKHEYNSKFNGKLEYSYNEEIYHGFNIPSYF